jgi:hypothetical protein
LRYYLPEIAKIFRIKPMPRNRVQHQKGLSDDAFERLYPDEKACLLRRAPASPPWRSRQNLDPPETLPINWQITNQRVKNVAFSGCLAI